MDNDPIDTDIKLYGHKANFYDNGVVVREPNSDAANENSLVFNLKSQLQFQY